MATSEHAPSLYHPDLDHIVIPQNPSDLSSSPYSWFVALKLMQACIEQGRRDFSALNDQIMQLENTARDTNVEIADLLAKNTKEKLTIVNLRSQIDMLNTSEKLPDPELYDGDKQKLRSWTCSLRLKLARNADHYPTEASKIRYSVSRLTGKALDQVEPKVKKDGTIDFATTNDLIIYLEIAFGDPDEKGTSQRELQNLRQTNRAFSDYLADFRRMADRTGYGEEAKRAALLAGLSQETQQALVVLDLPEPLEEVIAKVQKIDNKLRAFNSRTSRNQTLNLTSQNPSSQLGPRPKPVQSASPPAGGFSHPSGATLANTSAAREPIDIGVRRARGPLVPAERLRRMNNNLCMYCGGANHYVGNCPKAANRKAVVM